MNNEEKMVEQIEKIMADNSEQELVKGVNDARKANPVDPANKGAIGSIFLGIIITITIVGGAILGFILAK